MNMAVKGIVNMHLRDRISWFLIPWCIMTSSFLINLIIAGTMNDDQIITGGLASIYIYSMVSGIVAVNHTFPFALGLSVRRRDYFTGTMMMILAVSIVTSIVLTVLSYIEDASNGWGVRLFFFHLPYVTDGNAFQQFIVFFSFLLFMYLFGFVISSLFRRFGRTGLLVAAIVSLIIGTVLVFAIIHLGWWRDIFDFFDGRSAFNIALLLLPVTIVCSLVSYALLRRSTI